METVLKRIAELVENKPEYKLQTLVHVLNKENLKQSHERMDGKKAVGIDKLTKMEYENNLEENLTKLVERMKSQSYKPQPVRRVNIPKEGSNKTRPLGIPSYEDKLVQDVLRQMLNVIFEPNFMNFSYGFRPNRSQHDAIKALNTNIVCSKTRYIVDVDIKGFFDNVDHNWMMKFLQEKIADANFLRIISRFLKAGIMEEGKHYDTDKGVPQGGCISPILGNVYLHYILDLWFSKVIKQKNHGECSIVRYADDFVCCFQHKYEAENFLIELKERLAKFGLEIAEEKTKIIEFGRFAEEDMKRNGKGKPGSFDFLGFTHSCGKGRNGKFIVIRKTSKKKLKAKMVAVKEWLWKNMHKPIKEIIDKLNTKLIGHYRYYGVNGNSKSMNYFRHYIIQRLRWTLNRRSQKGKYSWDEFKKRILEKMAIKVPKIYVNIYESGNLATK